MAPPASLDKDLWQLFNVYSNTKTTNAALQSLSPKIKEVLLKELKGQQVSYWHSRTSGKNGQKSSKAVACSTTSTSKPTFKPRDESKGVRGSAFNSLLLG